MSGTKAVDFCSDHCVEPLPGSAKQEKVYVVFEWPSGWSRDVLDGDTFGPELTARLKKKLKGVAGLQLARRPGRDGRQVGNFHRCYLVWTQQAVMEMVLLSGPEAILDLDLSGPGRNGGGAIDTPLVLVCTHGRRDVCCAVKGRPLAAELNNIFPASLVWETSHTKGHRFAPSLLLMPWGYSFGQLNIEAARSLVKAAIDGEYFIPGNRGRGMWGPPGQVAELAVARKLCSTPGCGLKYDDLSVEEPHSLDNKADEAEAVVRHRDGRTWRVRLARREVHGVISSCGDAPKTGRVWDATGIEEVSA